MTGSTLSTTKIANGRRDDQISVLVRILARQAARERFEREVAAERDTPPEVTLRKGDPQARSSDQGRRLRAVDQRRALNSRGEESRTAWSK
jgi:hypothetical protein